MGRVRRPNGVDFADDGGALVGGRDGARGRLVEFHQPGLRTMLALLVLHYDEKKEAK